MAGELFWLPESGADKDSATNDGWTALVTASHYGHLEVVRLLLQSGADKDLATNDGWRALLAARVRG